MSKLEEHQNHQKELSSQGESVLERGNEAMEEASDTVGILESIDAVDEETTEIVEQARQSCRETARTIGENDVEQPADEIQQTAEGFAEEAEADSETERKNADSLSGVGAEYSDSVNGAVQALGERAEQFHQAGEQLAQLGEMIQQRAVDAAARLEGIF